MTVVPGRLRNPGLQAYCEILFIRGDPIFVVFVDSLAHEFKIPRIMNTISNIIVTIIFKLPILGCTSIDIC